jgi:hypothetical protein
MLIAPNDFLKNFLWKYIDISITNSDVCMLKTLFCNDMEKLNDNFDFMYKYDIISHDSANIFIFILLQINTIIRYNFLKFYLIQYKKFFKCDDLLLVKNWNELNDFIDSEKKFELFLFSIYQYF